MVTRCFTNRKCQLYLKFHSDLLYEDNTLDVPDRIAPVKAAFTGEGKTLSATVEPLTFAIYIVER